MAPVDKVTVKVATAMPSRPPVPVLALKVLPSKVNSTYLLASSVPSFFRVAVAVKIRPIIVEASASESWEGRPATVMVAVEAGLGA